MKDAPKVWQQALAEHTGQWAFILSISRRMVFFLQIIRDQTYWDDRGSAVEIGSPRRHFVTSLGCLEARGLIERVMRPTHVSNGVQHMGIDWKLTPAGELVCQLLVFAGLMPAKLRRRARKVA